MIDRRQFLRDTASVAGMIFTGCSLLDSRLRAQQSGVRQRRQVMAGGRRIRTIDIHAHVIVPEATALMGVKTAPDNPSVALAERFARMDEWGTDMQALSINPPWYETDRDVASRVIQVQNEKLAELCGKYQDRFVA